MDDKSIKAVYDALENILRNSEVPIYYYSIGGPADYCIYHTYIRQ